MIGRPAINRPEYIIQPGSPWYERVAAEIGQQELSLGTKGAKTFKLDLLRRIARRVDEFSSICGECENYKKEITTLVEEVNLALQTSRRQPSKDYTRVLNGIIQHLKKVHKLVDKGHYMAMGTGIGVALGAAVGGVLGGALGDNGIGTAVGPGAGIALGAGIGAYFEEKAKREGRII